MIELRSCVTYQELSAEELIEICTTRGDAEAWGEFTHRFHRLIAGIAFRTARRYGTAPPALVEDLVQEVYLKLCADRCRLLRSFKAEHPDALFGYLKVIAANVVHDHFKGANAAKRGAGLDPAGIEAIEQSPVSDSGRNLWEVEQGVLLSQIDSVLQTKAGGDAARRDRSIFWLYYRQGLSARAISLLPSMGLTAKGVESTILRLTRLVRDGITRHREAGSGEKDFPARESIS
jgi:RNA polymerase sigma-70 factor (ECF subfamily)